MDEIPIVISVWSDPWFPVPMASGVLGAGLHYILRTHGHSFRESVLTAGIVSICLFLFSPGQGGTVPNYTFSRYYKERSERGTYSEQWQRKFVSAQYRYRDLAIRLRAGLTVFLGSAAFYGAEKTAARVFARRLAMKRRDREPDDLEEEEGRL